MRVTNQKGQEFELQGGEWVPVGPAPGERAPGAPQAPAERLTTGAFNAAMVGAGDVFNTIGINARELWNRATGDIEGQAIAQEDRAEAAKVRARLRDEAPIASAVGAALPSLATLPLGLGAGTGAGMMAARLGTGTQLGRAAEAVALGGGLGAATSESGDMAGDAGIGAGLGAVGSMAGQMVARISAGRRAAQEAAQAGGWAGTLTGGEREVLDAAQRAGMRVTPGQAIGSKAARDFEARLSSSPWTSAPFVQIDEANRLQLNSLAARAMGQEADNVGPAVRAQAADKIGAQFREVGRSMGPVDASPLKKALQDIEAEEGTAVFPLLEVKSLLRRFSEGEAGRVAATGGEEAQIVSGAALMRERSRIAKQMRDAYASNNSDRGELYGRVLAAIDETAKKALVANVGGKEAERIGALYDTARDQWNVLRALDRGGASPDGNVLAGQAARLVGQGDKTRYLRGGLKGTGKPGESPLGDFYDALRFSSSQLGRPSVGNSGTATRLGGAESLLSGNGWEGLTARAIRFATASPAAKLYARTSPESAAMLQGVARSMMAAQGGRAGSAGASAVRGGSAWEEFNGQ
jgi:hypothetical protein